MGDKKENYTYKYYLFDDYRPVRVTLNERGTRILAEEPDAQSQGLVNRTNLIYRMDRDGFFDEIDRADFDRLCAEVYAKKPK